ncbi:MAG: hypothetical protein WCQ21_30550 [Verrucomicrobiota bacterium]|jgi:hypothetical protein
MVKKLTNVNGSVVNDHAIWLRAVDVALWAHRLERVGKWVYADKIV